MTHASKIGPQQALLDQLVVAISRLARPPESQIAYLETLGTWPSADELALELDDVAGEVLGPPALLSEHQKSVVRALDKQLGEMSGSDRAELWSEEALRTSPEWERVRSLARSALRELHISP